MAFWDRLARLNSRIGDALLAFALLAVELVVLIPGPSWPVVGGHLLSVLLVACTTLPLVWRRRAPLLVLLLVAVPVVTCQALGYSPITTLPLQVMVYSTTAYENRSQGVAVALLVAMSAEFTLWLRTGTTLGDVAAGAAWRIGLPAALGRIVRDRRRWSRRDRELATEHAVDGERARIARELHDVIVHTLGVMIVQAGGARAILRRDPDQAEDALRRIEGTGRAGVAEMRGLLAVIRDDGDRAPLTPQAGLHRLDELLEQMRTAGLPVDMAVEGTARPLPSGVDLAVYRIVQESLTNTLRHAGPARARVRLRYGEDTLEVEVIDDGRGPAPAARRSTGLGRGLIGMRERVAVFGGELRTAAPPSGGFIVQARLPAGEAA